ncbi:MAG TPA: hypothetical protein VL357_06530 [Rariglobus sp.]|jgi:hypothetical protein|nr:hypothetical protein [Rariglobus sp.]
MRTLISIVTTILLTVGTMRAAPALDFKGLQFGITLKDAIPKYKKLQGERHVMTDGDGVLAINISDTIAGLFPKNILMFFVQDDPALRPTNYSGSIEDVSPGLHEKILGCRLHTVSSDFSPIEFTTLKAALVEKYGPPTTETVNVMENGFGAKFDSHTITWKMDNGRIRLEEYYRTTETSQLTWMLNTPWPKKDATEAAKDL